ncbi:MAG: universal stress protein [Pseudomonadota bacterium]
MVSKREVREPGHRRKFLCVVDSTPECSKAIHYAARRVQAIDADLVLVYVIEPEGFQHWLGVEDVMRAEARTEAEAALARAVEMAQGWAEITPEVVVREGKSAAEVSALIDEDHDIALLILAAGDAKEGPGPLVASVASGASAFPIPVTVVPATLSDADIDDIV